MACWRIQQGTEASRWHVMTGEQQLAVRRFLSHDKDLIIILNVLRIYLERWGRERLRERERKSSHPLVCSPDAGSGLIWELKTQCSSLLSVSDGEPTTTRAVNLLPPRACVSMKLQLGLELRLTDVGWGHPK